MTVGNKRNLIKIAVATIALAGVSCSSADAPPPADAAAEAPRDTIGELISRVRGTSRLYTSEYQVNKLVSYDDVRRLKGSIFGKKFDVRLPQGDRRVLIPVEAVIKGYIDFGGFSADNVKVDSTHITVILPDPVIEVMSTKVDHHNIKEYTDYGRPSFTAAELSMLERQGRAAIVASIPQMGITGDARRNAYDVIVPMLEAMGYTPGNIVVEFRSEFTTDDYADKIIRIDNNLK